MKLYTLAPKEFKRRFKLNRPLFDDLVEKIKPIVEVGKRGKEMAKRSSGSFVPAALQLAATLRWLAGAHHACQEDNYNLGRSTFFSSVWKVIYALDFVLPRPDFDPKDEGGLRGLADGMYVRSGRLVPGCIGALGGMAVHIDRPSLKDTPAPLSYKNRKKYYSINLQAIADHDRKFIKTRSIHAYRVQVRTVYRPVLGLYSYSFSKNAKRTEKSYRWTFHTGVPRTVDSRNAYRCLFILLTKRFNRRKRQTTDENGVGNTGPRSCNNGGI